MPHIGAALGTEPLGPSATPPQGLSIFVRLFQPQTRDPRPSKALFLEKKLHKTREIAHRSLGFLGEAAPWGVGGSKATHQLTRLQKYTSATILSMLTPGAKQ